MPNYSAIDGSNASQSRSQRSEAPRGRRYVMSSIRIDGETYRQCRQHEGGALKDNGMGGQASWLSSNINLVNTSKWS